MSMQVQVRPAAPPAALTGSPVLCFPSPNPPLAQVDLSPAQVSAQLAALQAALPPNIDVERLVAAEPMLLRADIQKVPPGGEGGQLGGNGCHPESGCR